MTVRDLIERLDFGSKKFDLIKKAMIPVSPKLLRDLGYNFDEVITAFHCTNANDLKTLKHLPKNSQLSCFTKPSLKLTKLPSNPNVVVKVKGRAILQGASDLYSYLDDDGRRWIQLPSSSLKFMIESIAKKLIKNYKTYSNKLYREYIKDVENLLDKEYREFNKILKRLDNDLDYDELILDRIKVEGVYELNSEKKDEIEKNKFKYLGYLSARDFQNLKV